MEKIKEWIRRRPIIAFYIITFAITWGLGYSYIAVLRHDQIFFLFFASIATCGPALAGMIVTSIENQEPKAGSKKARWTAFFIALLVGTAIFAAFNVYINKAPFSIFMVLFIMLLVVTPVAYVISGAFSRNPSVRSLLETLVNPKRAYGWVLIAVIFVPALVLLSIPISNLLGRSGDFSLNIQGTGLQLAGLILIKFLYQWFFYNAAGEEAGWSGFVRRRLQTHVSPLITALIVTLFWAPWHAFFWYAQGREIWTAGFWLDTYFDLIPAAIILGWLYNRSKGNILVVGAGHAAANTAFDLLANLNWQISTITISAAVLCLVLIDKMWKKLPAEDPAVYIPPSEFSTTT